MSIDSFREKVNLRIFNSKETVLLIFRILSFVVAFLAVGLLTYAIGFPQTDESRIIEIFLIKFLFGFYILNYLVRFLYTFEPARFVKTTWLELVLIILLLIEATSTLLFNKPLVQEIMISLDAASFIPAYHFVLQFILLILLIIDLAKATTLLDMVKVDPSVMFVISFMILCFVGTVLLMLPEMTTSDVNSDFITALFTSTSASCVTGLVVVDVSTYFTFKGHLVLLVLMQLGGLSIIAFATFFASFYTKGVGSKHHSMIPDYFTSVSNFDSKTLLRRILLISILFEMIGVVLMYLLWDPAIKFESFGDKLFFSIFHAVSAFNNVGLTLFSDGLYSAPINGSFILHMTFGVLVYFGSLGFSTIRDVFGIKANMERMKLLWKRYSISTKISLYGSLILLAFGAVVFYLLERENTLANMNGIEQVIRSLFQSVNKTSGFNTVIIGELRSSTLILLIFLMFIGASSGSIGGGIKTSTFTIIMVSAFSTIRGKKNLELFKHNISWELLNKAYTIFIFSASFIFISVFALTILEPDIDIMRIVFEAVSAFATTGWSTGITAQLTTPSKLILITSMFVGRIGTLTIAFALSKRVKTVAYKYPNAEFMVG